MSHSALYLLETDSAGNVQPRVFGPDDVIALIPEPSRSRAF